MLMAIDDSKELRARWRETARNGELAILLLELFEQRGGSIINHEAREALGFDREEFSRGIVSLRKYLERNTGGRWAVPRHPDQVAPHRFEYRLTDQAKDKLDSAHKLQILGSNKLIKAVDIILSLAGVELSQRDIAQIKAVEPMMLAVGALHESRLELERAGVDLERISQALTPPHELEHALAIVADESPHGRLVRLQGAARRQIEAVISSSNRGSA